MSRRAAAAALLLSVAALAAADEPAVYEGGGYAASYEAWLARSRKVKKHNEEEASPPVLYQRNPYDHRLRRRALPPDPAQYVRDHPQRPVHDYPLRPESVQAALQLGGGLHSPVYSQQPAVFIPKIGVANVTTPTAFPPPPATLEYDRDYQPLDTWIGNMVASSFVSPMTITPPPTQGAIDLAFACPMLLAFPSVVQVGVYGTCIQDSTSFSTIGNWTTTGDTPTNVVDWSMKCNPSISTQPHMQYVLPNGDFFGVSLTEASIFGSDMKLLDCGWAKQNTIKERVFKQNGAVDFEVCQKYKSCDGTVYLQYEILDSQDKTIARTPYLTLFQDEFTISDPNGVAIATMKREGQWNPMDSSCSNVTRQWRITFSGGAPGSFSTAPGRWPVAMMMNMVAHRDAYRRATGMVFPTECEVASISGGIVVFFVFIGVVVLLVSLFVTFCRPTIKERLLIFEQALFPKYMCKPSMYEGNG